MDIFRRLAMLSRDVRDAVRDCVSPNHAYTPIDHLIKAHGPMAVWLARTTGLIEPARPLPNNKKWFTITDAGRRALEGQGNE